MNQLSILQAWLRIWTRDYQEQIQLAVRAGLELGVSGIQVRRSNRSVTLPPQNNWLLCRLHCFQKLTVDSKSMRRQIVGTMCVCCSKLVVVSVSWSIREYYDSLDGISVHWRVAPSIMSPVAIYKKKHKRKTVREIQHWAEWTYQIHLASLTRQDFSWSKEDLCWACAVCC